MNQKTYTLHYKKIKLKKIMENVREEIIKIEELKYLFIEESAKEFGHLHECVMKTREYPILNEYINLYLKQNPDKIDKKNKKGWSALMLASRYSKTDSSEETVEILLKHGANINLRNNDDWTALMLASRNSRIDSSEETVRILLEHGANVNLQNKAGQTALMFASGNSKTDSSEETVRILLEHGANINLQDNTGWTALMFAVKYSKTDSSEETVRMLLEHGAYINIKLNGMKLITILYDLYLKNEIDVEIIGLLITFGANFSDLPVDKNLKNILKEKGYLKSKLHVAFNYFNRNDVKINESTCQICFNDNVKVTECDKEHKICLNCNIKLNFKCEFCHPRN